MSILDKHSTSIWLLLTFSITCQFIPVIINERFDNRPQLGYYVLTDRFYVSSLEVAVVLCIPILLELALDYLFTPRCRTSNIDYVVYHKCSIVFTFFVPNLLILLFCIHPAREQLYLCLKQLMIILLGFPTLLLMNYYDNDIWTNNRTGFILVMNAMARVLGALFYITGNIDFELATILFRALLIPVGLPLIVMWFYRHGACIRDVFMLRPSEDSQFGDARALSVFYVLVAFFAGISFYSISLIYPESINIVMNARTNIIVQVIAVSLIALIPGRLARRDAIQSDNKLENKKSFVQYVSHEARGPLSVANMGLELHLQDMMAMDKQISGKKPPTARERLVWMREMIGHVEEIVDACSLAQATLSDLLTFDKIESGVTDMEKTPFQVISFVDSITRAFAIQARYKNIDIAYNWLSSLDVDYEHMTVMADRGKLSQALRNLLSNALKFSPEGGKLSVVIKVFRKRTGGVFDATPFPSIHSVPSVGVDSLDEHNPILPSTPQQMNTADDHSVSAPASPSSRALWGAALGSPKACKATVRNKINWFIDRMVSNSFKGDGLSNTSNVADQSTPSMSACYSGHSDIYNSIFVDVSQKDASRSENQTDSTHRGVDSSIENLVCRIEVHDSGPGISRANISKLFGKFVQFDAARIQQGGGSGLGLWLTRSIMEGHRGGIGARSEGIPGKGSTFFIDIPLYSLQELDENGQFVPAKMLALGKVEEEGSDTPRRRMSDRSSYGANLSSRIAKIVTSTFINQVFTSGESRDRSEGVPSVAMSATEQTGRDAANGKWNDYEEQQAIQNAALAHQIMLVKANSSRTAQKDKSFSCVDQASDNSSGKVSPIYSFDNSGKLAPIAVMNMSGASAVTGCSSSGVVLSPTNPPVQATSTVPMFPTGSLKPTPSSTQQQRNGTDCLCESRSISSIKNELESSPHIHVMVVDDMASNRKVLRRAVCKQGRDVVCDEYNDGADALNIVSKSLRSRPPPPQDQAVLDAVYYDIIFMDCQMGVMDGPVACRKMRELGYTGLIYGISGDARSIDTFKEAGANGGYTKPMKMNDLKLIFEGYKATLLGEAGTVQPQL